MKTKKNTYNNIKSYGFFWNVVMQTLGRFPLKADAFKIKLKNHGRNSGNQKAFFYFILVKSQNIYLYTIGFFEEENIYSKSNVKKIYQNIE